MIFSTTPDSAITYEGQSYPDLGITQGDPLSQVLTKVLERVQSLNQIGGTVSTLETKVNSLNTTEIKSEASLFGLGSSGSTCISQIIERSFTYSISGNLFSYDLSGVKNSLPQGFTFQSVKVSGGGGSSISSINSFTVLSTPLTVQVEVNIGSPCGQIRLSKSLYVVANASGSGILSPQAIDSTQPSNLSQKDFDNIISSQLSAVTARVDELSSLSIQNNLSKTSGDLAQTNTSLGALESTVTSEVAALKTSLATLQAYADLLNQRITDIEVS